MELAAIWQERGASELKVAGGFSALSAQLIERGTGDGVLKLVSRAVRDEVHHAEIAVEMAARYRSSAINNRRDVVSRPSVSSPAVQARMRRRRVV